MSWVIIAVAAIFIVFGIIGWKKGIIRIAVSLAAMIITLIVCVGVTPVLCSAVRQNTTLYDKLRESVYNFMIEDESFNEAADESIEDSENAVVESDKLEEYSAAIEHYAAAVMQKLHLPDSVVTQPAEAAAGVVDEIADSIGTGSIAMKNITAAVVAARLASIALNAIIYIIVFLVVYIVLRIIFAVTGLISHLPVIHQANQVLGLVFGLLEGLVVVWIMFAVITACSNSAWAAKALIDIGRNDFLSFLYDKNILIKTIIKSI